MFLSDEKLDVTQISLTGTRALTLIGLLILEPRSFEEIKNKFIELGLFENKSSDDILRIDIGTIKSMGCELSRPCQSNGYKYVLQKHPFSLTLNLDDVKLLKRTYNKLKNNLDLETIIEYDNLFRKIADHVYNAEIQEALLGISILKYYNIEALKESYSDCNSQKILELVYRNPETKKDTLKKIKTQKLFFQNDKIYMYGYDLDKQTPTILLYKRIKNIISKTEDEKPSECESIKVTYQLKRIDKEILSENENIIEQNNEKAVIRAEFFNEFYAMQKVLSYGSNCTVLSPIEFRDSVINKLKEMREVYNG